MWAKFSSGGFKKLVFFLVYRGGGLEGYGQAWSMPACCPRFVLASISRPRGCILTQILFSKIGLRMFLVVLQPMDAKPCICVRVCAPSFCGLWWSSATPRADSTPRHPSFTTHAKVGVAAASVCMTGMSSSNSKVRVEII